jgi:hypothetical protein
MNTLDDTTVNLKIVGPGKEKTTMCIRKDAYIKEIVDRLHSKTGYKITFLMQGTHALNMTKKLADHNMQDGTEIRAEGTLEGGMEGDTQAPTTQETGDTKGRAKIEAERECEYEPEPEDTFERSLAEWKHERDERNETFERN